MYIHLGNETVINSDEIIGIFDLDTSTISKHTRDYLTLCEKKGEIINVSYELPKSFILCKSKDKNKIYLCQFASKTLQKRILSRKEINL